MKTKKVHLVVNSGHVGCVAFCGIDSTGRECILADNLDEVTCKNCLKLHADSMEKSGEVPAVCPHVAAVLEPYERFRASVLERLDALEKGRRK